MSKGKIIGKSIQEMIDEIRKARGSYEAKRLERAADEVPNLERLYQREALEGLFSGDNAKGVMTMRPGDFERYATPLDYMPTDPKTFMFGELAGSKGQAPKGITQEEYLRYLANLGGFEDVPFLEVNAVKRPRKKPELAVTGHEGRHRSRALEMSGQPSSLVQFLPRAGLREPFPRRSREEYIQALNEEMSRYANMVRPQQDGPERRPLIKLPDIYKQGGPVHMSKGGRIAKSIGAMAAELSKKRAVLPKEEAEANLRKMLESSKVQQRLYHGTTATEGGKGQEAIRRFKPSKEGALGSGSYLTPKPDMAGLYAGQSRPHEGGNILPVYAQIKNPLVIEGNGDPMIEALIKLGMDEDKASRMVERAYENKGYIGKEVESRARAAGYDGLMQYRDGELSEVVSYNPNAIKSAIGNVGTYDTSVPDLSKAKGGPAHKAAGGIARRLAKYGKHHEPAKKTEIFIGEKSPLWDQDAAGAAVKMEKSGVSPVDIWKQTGTFRSPDGALRQEISDVGSKFRGEKEMKELAASMKQEEEKIKAAIAESKLHPDLFPKQLTAAQKQARQQAKDIKARRTMEDGPEYRVSRGNRAEFALEHPELYEAYPLLSGMDVQQGGGHSSFMASYTPGINENDPGLVNIYDRGLKNDPRSSAIHEVQHAIQNIEGWGRGGSPTTAFQNQEAFDILNKMRKQLLEPLTYEEYVKVFRLDSLPSDEAIGRYETYKKGLPDATKKMDAELQRQAAKIYYDRLAGEAEARAAQARIDLTPQQRLENFPLETGTQYGYDVKPEDIIVKRNKKGGQVSIDAMRLAVQNKANGGAATSNEAMLRRAKRLGKVDKPVSIPPLQLARGWAAGTAGMPGDIESLVRVLVPGMNEETFLPTSEDLLKKIPGAATDEVGQRAAEIGTLFGGAGTALGGKLAAKGAKAIAPKIGETAEEYMFRAGMALPAVPPSKSVIDVAKPAGKSKNKLVTDRLKQNLDLVGPERDIAKKLGAEDRSRRQALIEQEGRRAEAAKNVQDTVGYRESTPSNPDPLVGTRYTVTAPVNIVDLPAFDPSKHLGANASVLDWDSTARNTILKNISGRDLPFDIKTHGGHEYPADVEHLAKNIAGASGEKIAKRVADRINTSAIEGEKRGGTGEALSIVQTMGEGSERFALPTSQFAFDIIADGLMRGTLKESDVKDIERMVRERKNYGNLSGFKGFNEEGWDQFHTGSGLSGTTPGKLRTAIGEVLGLKGTQELLDFNIEDLVNAITAKKLINVPKGFIGSSVIQSPAGGTKTLPSPLFPYDSPYSTDFTGKGIAQFPEMINTEALFYRVLNPIKRELLDRPNKKPYDKETLRQSALGAIAKRKENVSQLIDNQFLDDYNTYLYELSKRNEFKKGGAVKKAEGGQITADDLIVEERPL